MSPEISERSFEEAIECGLLQHGPDACAGDATAVRETSPSYGVTPPGGYRKRTREDYDRALCLLPRDVVDFVLATQPKAWKKLEQHHGAAVREQFLRRLAAEVERRGALDVLRNGLKDSGCKFQLAYFRPASGLNEEPRRLHAANLFAVVRQVHYSTKNKKSLDLVLFLNGLPVFTAELKNPLSGQDVEDAIRQYKTDRDPREPLLAYGRHLHRSQGADRAGQDRLRGELPAQPGARVSQMEGDGVRNGRRLFRAERAGHGEAAAGEHEGIHPNTLWRPRILGRDRTHLTTLRAAGDAKPQGGHGEMIDGHEPWSRRSGGLAIPHHSARYERHEK